MTTMNGTRETLALGSRLRRLAEWIRRDALGIRADLHHIDRSMVVFLTLPIPHDVRSSNSKLIISLRAEILRGALGVGVVGEDGST
jgi:hypothetical protein